MGYLTPLQRRGLALSGVAFSFCAFIVSYFKGFVKRFFWDAGFFLFSTFADSALSYRSSISVLLEEMATLATHPLGSNPSLPLWTPLLYHNLGDLSRGFSKFFLCYSHPIGQPYARSFTSSWHHYNTTPRSRIQDGIIHKIGKNNLCIFIAFFSWQIAGTVV